MSAGGKFQIQEVCLENPGVIADISVLSSRDLILEHSREESRSPLFACSCCWRGRTLVTFFSDREVLQAGKE